MAYIFITKEKTNWKYLLIIFILGIIIGAGTLWLSSKQRVSPVELPEIKKQEKVEDETANWKTYKNSEYKYEVKYPGDWLHFGELGGGFNITSPMVGGRADNRIVVLAYKKEGSESNQEYIDNMIKDNTLPGYLELNRKKEITINGIKGYEIVWNQRDPEANRLEEGPLMIFLESPTGNKSRFIVFQFQGKGSQYEKNLQIFNQMLSTFRFSPH